MAREYSAVSGPRPITVKLRPKISNNFNTGNDVAKDELQQRRQTLRMEAYICAQNERITLLQNVLNFKLAPC